MRLARSFVLLLAVVALSACGGGGDEPTPGAQPTERDETQQVETDEAGTHEEAGAGNPEAGKAVWVKAGCGRCHTLAAAGSTGTIGPNLDEHMKEEREHGVDVLQHVIEQVRNGGDKMPAFKGKLTEKQIRDVAAFVHDATMEH